MSTVNEILDQEARTMGRDVTLVNAHATEVRGIEFWAVIYDCAPLEFGGRVMDETRWAVWVDGQQSAGGIVSTRRKFP